jgi:hypothetical protein
MKKECSSVSKLLEKYFDQEVTHAERSLVEAHLPDCLSCRDVLRSMERLRNFIRTPVEEAVEKEDLPWVWQKIERKIRLEEKRPWWDPVREWLDLTRVLKKKVLIPVAVAAVVLILIVAPLLFEKTPSTPDPSVVEYVASETYNVMVYELETPQVTVIWLFEGPEQESPTS